MNAKWVFPKRLASLLLCATLAACSSTDDENYVEQKVEPLYNEAADALEDGDYREAARLFNEVDRQHPYSAWATRAQLMAAYANYSVSDYDEAVIVLDRFISLHPGNKDIDYAHYLRSLCFYERISDVSRDQQATGSALAAFEEILRRFPDSKYARDVRLKADLARDHLAGKEMEVGRFYLGRGHHLAAINRFRSVVDRYQTTTHAAEALHRLVEAYTALGVTGEAGKAAAVLGHNYPGSDWYLDSYALAGGEDLREKPRERGFFERLWDWLF